MATNGKQYIEIILQNFILSVQLKYLMKMSSFGNTDESVIPPKPEVYYSTLNLPPLEPVPVAAQNEQKIQISINNVLILLQSKQVTNCLATRGEIQIQLVMKPNLSYLNTLQIMKEKELTY